MASKKYYTIWEGNKTGVFDSWDECLKHIKGYPGAKYKSFPTKEEATEAISKNYWKFVGKNNTPGNNSKEGLKNIGKPILESISVDGACSSATNEMEYQCVHTKTKKSYFQERPV